MEVMSIPWRTVKTIALDKWNERYVEACFRSNVLEFL
jgi:hypothetical protein